MAESGAIAPFQALQEFWRQRKQITSEVSREAHGGRFPALTWLLAGGFHGDALRDQWSGGIVSIAGLGGMNDAGARAAVVAEGHAAAGGCSAQAHH